jgi:hypothetical protein
MKNNAYRNTSVHWSKSQAEIVKMLTARGIYQTRFANLEDKFAVEFIAPQENGKPVGVRIVVRFSYYGDNEQRRQNELNRLHRVLFYQLKAKFVGIDNGLVEFMTEFMARLIVTERNGNSTTMGETALPQYKESLKADKQKDFKLLSDGQ